ncbi:hypothetical protein DY052_06240 [Apilactobacillus timberlakei]|uniref:hypothetical protein n=1 Tax=Apilactobacillus timberlakei TaxID=2008380 RepID=UPI001128C2A8|nr:hypothetical protein [Apilactobacillus timberlakei]TPR15023.1 hypothetical protein DY052_06240 [Apilactobacillus timberlakei]
MNSHKNKKIGSISNSFSNDCLNIMKGIPTRCKIQLLLDSKISGYEIAKSFQISPIKISQLRNKKSSINNISLLNVENLEHAFNYFLDANRIEFAKEEKQVEEYLSVCDENVINSYIQNIHGIYYNTKIVEENPHLSLEQSTSIFPNEYGNVQVELKNVDPFFNYQDIVSVKLCKVANTFNDNRSSQNLSKDIYHLTIKVYEKRIPKFYKDK